MDTTELLTMMVWLLLGSTGFLVVNHRLKLALLLLAFQSLLLAGIALWAAVLSGVEHLYLAVALTVLIKVVLVSGVLGRVLRSAKTKIESGRGVLGRGLSLSLCVVLVLVSYRVAQPVHISNVLTSSHSLFVSISMVLIGLLLMVSRKKALMQVVGLLTIENGLFLLALSTTYGLPVLVEVGIFLDVGLSIVVLGLFAFQMNRVFETMDTTTLRNLKG
jgi:hydrogenase-4 component E